MSSISRTNTVKNEGHSRLLISARRECPFNCKYCFADMKSYKLINHKMPKLGDVIESNSGLVVLYPSCDSEVLISDTTINQLVDFVSSHKRPVISYSTKRSLSERELSRFEKISNIASKYGGLLKISISISTKDEIEDIEAGAASYEHRIRTMEALNKQGIPTSLNLKPILPTTSIKEYLNIVDDFIKLTDVFLIGGLYTDPSSEYGKKIARLHSNLHSKRTVPWLPEKPIWDYYSDEGKMSEISEYIHKLGGHCFDSDSDVIDYFLCRIG